MSSDGDITPERPAPGEQNPQTASPAESDTAPTQVEVGGGGSGSPATGTTDGASSDGRDVGIPDEALPEDLRPTDDNPLAQPPSDDRDPGGMDLTGSDANQGGTAI